MKDRVSGKDWAQRAELRFQETVAREIARHHRSGRPVYFQRGRRIYALHPGGRTQQVRSVPAAARLIKDN